MKIMRQNVRSQQRKVGKSVDLLVSQGIVVPKMNKDYLVVYAEEQPRVSRRLSACPPSTALSG